MSDIWDKNYYRVGNQDILVENTPTDEEAIKHRNKIEPWLTSVFQSEHLSLLLGSGFTRAIAHMCGVSAVNMDRAVFGCELEEHVNRYAQKSAELCGRGSANIEDQIRAAISLISGLEIIEDSRCNTWKKALDNILSTFLKSILQTEKGIKHAIENDGKVEAYEALISFLLSFASRTATRERLNLFTTNYDRLIEYGCDAIGLRVIDRFVGSLNPVFRSSRVEVDMHYNPPGIRGEPRYLEGVIRLTKLHGSIDWMHVGDNTIRRYGIPFGSSSSFFDTQIELSNSVMIYPNPAKDIETLHYPYAELFRDFSASICRPNSVLVTYGYGFGDDHINRIIKDMLTIPSTHLVIISYNKSEGRISRFCEKVGRRAQISILLGNHFGNLPDLVKYYLPKPAIDRITDKMMDLLAKRGGTPVKENLNIKE